MLLEICANSLQSALNAQKGGANRIELCTNLEVGGITPNLELLEAVKVAIQIPVYVLIRPRGGDFIYTHQELDLMLKQIEQVKALGYHGVVIGALTARGHVNDDQTRILMQAAGYMDVTFHKAFDEAKDQFEALDCLRELGVQRILTSGGAATAVEGINQLEVLLDEADDEVIIMPGGGIRPGNINLLKSLEAREYHSACIAPGTEFTNQEMVEELAKALRVD